MNSSTGTGKHLFSLFFFDSLLLAAPPLPTLRASYVQVIQLLLFPRSPKTIFRPTQVKENPLRVTKSEHPLNIFESWTPRVFGITK